MALLLAGQQESLQRRCSYFPPSLSQSGGLLLQLSAEATAHSGAQFVLVIGLAARGESLVERGGEDRNRHGFVNRRLDCPAAFTGVGDAPGELRERRILHQAGSSQVQQPGGNYAAAPPYLRNVTQIKVVLVVLGFAQWGCFRICR